MKQRRRMNIVLAVDDEGQTGLNPFPEPDVEIDDAPGWRAERLEEIARWRDGLPGRGAGGGRPTAARQEYFRAAEARASTGTRCYVHLPISPLSSPI